MNRMTTADLRESYLQFFEKKGHTRLASDSLIPKSDPTVLFTGAGMMPFKDHFMGKADDGLKRATTCQKCVRTGDIENVGLTTRHLTFFEMLGNFSFGDYFKKEAIHWAWEYVTEVLKMPAEQLWATVYLDDDEAWRIWEEEIGLPASRIRRLGKKENFWEVPNMPCGPCSEIHIDLGEHIGCGRSLEKCGPECDCDRFSELWNLVFTQYQRMPDGSLADLPNPNIDTGMGLERVAAVLQGVPSVFDADQMQPILAQVADLSGITYGHDNRSDVSLRIVAEHARMSTFCIADHILPENVGRGYVLRRVMRRALRHGRILGIEGKFIGTMAEKVIEVMGDAYPELREGRETILRVAKLEEDNFTRTVERGLNRLDSLIEEARAKERNQLSGKDVFILYDTYGFPKDLAEEVLRDEGLGFDSEEFDREMEGQRQRAKAAWAGEKRGGGLEVDEKLVPRATDFVGYDSTTAEAKILALYAANEPAESLTARQDGILVLEKTPFYAESGGQVGDTGVIVSEDGHSRFSVSDVQKTPRGIYLHFGSVAEGEFKTGASVTATIDSEKRKWTVRNHTATHLLHAALRQQLGTHVKQAGSLVSPDRLRFDFSHYESIGEEDLKAIERQVNEWIMDNHDVCANVMSLEEAKKTGAMALFDEKYGNRVRVVAIGDNGGVSREFCGGTHATATGDIGLFRIVGESSISAGTRRVEALTGKAAYELTLDEERALKAATHVLRASPSEMLERIQKLVEQNRQLEKELERLSAEQTRGALGDLASQVEEINGAKVLARRIDLNNPKELQGIMDGLREEIPSGILFLVGVSGDKGSVLCSVSDDLTAKHNAGNILREAAAVAGGKGGGKANRAQGGIQETDKVDEVLAKAREVVSKAG